ncbi:MAG TPA: DUF3800 domain-containing protein [Pseudomonadales bacterium]|nr:DUF3800 domain-containing protein [Pseudomonadales bacterium]
MVVVYADETGTGGIPKSGEEPSPGVYGYIATPEEWEKFRVRWKEMLKKHKAKYFHFRELNKTERKKTDNPYHGWSDQEVDDFIYDMAFVASTGPIPFGGDAAQKRRKTQDEAFEAAFECFFADFTTQMNDHFPNETEKTSFFLSENQNEKWIHIQNKVIKEARKTDPRIGEATPINPYDEKDSRGIPCQAADLFAYVNRQNMSPMYDMDTVTPHRILDIIVARKGFIAHDHAFRIFAEMNDDDWYALIQDMRKAKKHFDSVRAKVGAPKAQYYPLREHPFIREQWLKFSYMKGALKECYGY